jgi:hypothetical protein
MVENKETNATIKRREGERPSEVMVDDTAILVGKCPETEDICYGFVAIICDDIGARLHAVCRAGVGWDDVGRKKRQDWGRYLWDGCRQNYCSILLFWLCASESMARAFYVTLGCSRTGILRYLSINVSDKLGHPLRNHWRTALRRVEILGLQRDWCANLTALA